MGFDLAVTFSERRLMEKPTNGFEMISQQYALISALKKIHKALQCLKAYPRWLQKQIIN